MRRFIGNTTQQMLLWLQVSNLIRLLQEIAVRLPIILIACAFLAACGGADTPTVIDGSSQSAFETSLRQARGEVGPADRIKLEAAIHEHEARMFAKADNRLEYQKLVREGMDGLTAPAIVSQFDKDVIRVKGQAADAIFDAKRALKKQ